MKLKLKQALLIIYFVPLLMATDCGKGKFHEYKIRNESGKDIKISSYRNIYPIRQTPIYTQLVNDGELTKTYQDGLPPSGYSFGAFFNGDSLIVNYNNERKQIFTFPTENDRNPFYNTGTNVTFVFTQQDYENAKPCNGNCD